MINVFNVHHKCVRCMLIYVTRVYIFKVMNEYFRRKNHVNVIGAMDKIIIH